MSCPYCDPEGPLPSMDERETLWAVTRVFEGHEVVVDVTDVEPNTWLLAKLLDGRTLYREVLQDGDPDYRPNRRRERWSSKLEPSNRMRSFLMWSVKSLPPKSAEESTNFEKKSKCHESP